MRDRSFPQGNHQVLFPDIAAARRLPKAKLVAFFRQPEDRLLSGYLHMIATPPCCTEDWGWNRATYMRVRRELAVHKPFALGSAWLRGRFHGCQTNMLLAKGCYSEHARTQEHIDAARAIVADFAFVGIVANWSLSICLFNRIMTGRRFTLTHQLARVRAGGQRNEHRSAAATKAKAEALAAQVHQMPKDPIDGPLYDYVRTRFVSDLRAHDVRPECCPNFESVQLAAAASEVC